MTMNKPMCFGCSRFNGYDYKHDDASTSDTDPAGSCDAFPDGIPTGILMSDLDHRRPIKGDHGLRYDPISAGAAQEVEDQWAARTSLLGRVRGPFHTR
jgi:hypothetical protein